MPSVKAHRLNKIPGEKFMSEKALIRRVITTGDKHAYGQLVREHQSDLRSSLVHLCNGDQDLADDLSQEAFIKAYKGISSFRHDAKFSTWLYRIAYNVTMSYFRKKNADLESDLQSVSSAEEKLRQDTNRDISRALARLNHHQRTAILLCMQRGFSHAETAKIMDIPIGTVKTHILRGKEKLKEILGPEYADNSC